jgi:hypothetical protein
LVIYRITWQL